MAREYFEPAREERGHDEARITSENFLWSTLPNSPLPRSEGGFADRLVLPHLARTIDRLYDFARDPDSYPDSEVELPESDVTGQGVVWQRSTGDGNMHTDASEAEQTVEDMDPTIEYGVTQYFEKDKGLVPIDSKFIRGKKSRDPSLREITLNVFPLIRQGRIPSVPMHTHPDPDREKQKKEDIDESDWDMALFLQQGAWGMKNPTLRAVNWQVILCENKQLLIGVTGDTPQPMPIAGIDNFLLTWETAFKEEDREEIEAMKAYAKYVYLEGRRRRPELEQQLVERLDGLTSFEQRLREGQLSESELAYCQGEMEAIDEIERLVCHPELLPEYVAAKDQVRGLERTAGEKVRARMRGYMKVVCFEATDGSTYDKVAA